MKIIEKNISYAQNGEDILLSRALSDIQFGFYIDIGAWDPVEDSVSKLFYDKNWCGINIDPLPESIEKFKTERPRDKNLQYAVSNFSGMGCLKVFPGTGWHTIQKKFGHEDNEANFHEIQVEVKTLNEIMEQIQVNEIHWLKIDAEGSEFEIIASIDFSKIRPWILVVEATLPNSPTKAENLWVEILKRNNYIFCFFDGLNEFWVSEEHEKLKEKLSYPAGVHDDFLRYSHHQDKTLLEENYQTIRKLEAFIESRKPVILLHKCMHLFGLNTQIYTCMRNLCNRRKNEND